LVMAVASAISLSLEHEFYGRVYYEDGAPKAEFKIETQGKENGTFSILEGRQYVTMGSVIIQDELTLTFVNGNKSDTLYFSPDFGAGGQSASAGPPERAWATAGNDTICIGVTGRCPDYNYLADDLYFDISETPSAGLNCSAPDEILNRIDALERTIVSLIK